MAMGPLAVADLSGIDVFWRILQEIPQQEFPAVAASGIEKLYKAGRLGQKTGAGFYRYDENRKLTPDPDVLALLQKKHRAIPDSEMVERCIYALINEGAKVLEEGIASRAVDIDVIYLTGYGFPAYRGGPMFYADSVGLQKIHDRIREFGWRPAPLLELLAREGKTFAGNERA
jgi:3-hydroxyacyl-CoA dehydrogenase